METVDILTINHKQQDRNTLNTVQILAMKHQ